MPYTTQTSDFWGWYMRHNNRVVWKNLSDAGMDVFLAGPSNNTQAFSDLTNILPGVTGGLSCRWGLTQALLNTAPSSHPLNRQIVRHFIYNYPQDQSNPSNTANTNVVFSTDGQYFYGWTDSWAHFTGYGPTTYSSPGPSVWATTSRGWLYYGDGVNAPRKVNPSYTAANTDSLSGIALPVNVVGSQLYSDYPCVLFPGAGGSSLNAVTSMYMTNPGSHFTVGQTYSASGGSGTGLSITVTAITPGPAYSIASYTIFSGGAGYVIGDSVAFGVAATFTVASVSAAVPANYGIGSTGLGYTASSSFTVSVTDITGGSGSGGVVTCYTDAAGSVVYAAVTSPGSSYTQGSASLPAPSSGGTQGYVTVYTQVNASLSNHGKIVGVDLAGPMSFAAGRRWTVALQNSLTGHTSDVFITQLPFGPKSGLGLNGLSDGLGVFDGLGNPNVPAYLSSPSQTAGYTQMKLQISVPATGIDSQVDTVVLLAAADGQSLGTLYQVGVFPLSTFTLSGGFYTLPYNDTLPDSYNSTANTYGTGNTLLEADLWAYTDPSGNSFGILLNTPPYASGFLYPTQHQGRLFATDGRTLFFSKSLDEVTTSTGLITSKWEECWPGDYQLPVALNNETILGLKSDGTNLHIGTDKSIFTLYGSDPSNFSIPSQAFAQTGILSDDLWTVIYAEGVPAGFVWVTQDLKVIHSDFSTYREIGTPILPILQTLDPAKIAPCKLTSLTQGPYNFVFLQFYPVSNAAPVFLLWESRLQKWYRWTLPATLSGSGWTTGASFVYQYPETTSSSFSPGSKFLFYENLRNSGGSNDFSINYFNPASVTSDFSTLPIPWNIQTSWQDCGDSTAIKSANEIELTSDYAASTYGVTTSIWGATSQAQFSTGGVLLKTGTATLAPVNSLGVYKLYCAGTPTAAKYYSLQFTNNNGSNISTASPSAIALSSCALEYYPMARI